MTEADRTFVWIFNGDGAKLASGVFSDRASAEAWIHERGMTGLLTRYPLGTGVFEWAVSEGLFTPKRDHHSSASFVQRFTSAAMEHYHYLDGECADSEAAAL